MSNLATPVAAVIGVTPRKFAAYSAVGAFVWAVTWLGLGALIEITMMPAVEQILVWAPTAVAVLAAAGLALLGIKLVMAWRAVRNDPHKSGEHPHTFIVGGSAASKIVSLGSSGSPMPAANYVDPASDSWAEGGDCQ